MPDRDGCLVALCCPVWSVVTIAVVFGRLELSQRAAVAQACVGQSASCFESRAVDVVLDKQDTPVPSVSFPSSLAVAHSRHSALNFLQIIHLLGKATVSFSSIFLDCLLLFILAYIPSVVIDHLRLHNSRGTN